jgi:hypothetical protein
MRDEMQSRLDQNLDRVQSLVELYERQAGSGPGRRGVKDADLLRAAVVFLHATLEDLLRTLLARRWPLTNMAELLDKIPFAWKKDKLSLSELVPHRDRKVSEIIEDAVESYLETSNFNNVGDVKEALRLLRHRPWYRRRASPKAGRDDEPTPLDRAPRRSKPG